MPLHYLMDTKGGNVKDDGLMKVFSANDHPQVTTSSLCYRSDAAQSDILGNKLTGTQKWHPCTNWGRTHNTLQSGDGNS